MVMRYITFSLVLIRALIILFLRVKKPLRLENNNANDVFTTNL